MSGQTLPEFLPENYPRVYGAGFRSVNFYWCAFFLGWFIFIFRNTYFPHHLFLCGVVPPIIYILLSCRRRLRLTAETVTYRGFFSTRTLRRDDIHGTRWIAMPAPHEPPHFVLLPKDEKMNTVAIPFIFSFDDYSDAWFSSLPFDSGIYLEGPIGQDGAPQAMEWINHFWMPKTKH